MEGNNQNQGWNQSTRNKGNNTMNQKNQEPVLEKIKIDKTLSNLTGSNREKAFK